MKDTTIVLDGGSVAYDITEASVPIADLIATLTEAQEDGATHVVMSSGNHRGAQWASIGTEYGWAE